MNLKCIKSKLIRLISYLIIICLLLFFAACSDSSTGEDNSNDNNTVRTPSGHLYFMTSNPASIVKYDIRSDQFNVLADENDQPINFSVSYNGSALAYISDNKKIVVLDLFNFWMIFIVITFTSMLFHTSPSMGCTRSLSGILFSCFLNHLNHPFK